jgi:hypothetical protein
MKMSELQVYLAARLHTLTNRFGVLGWHLLAMSHSLPIKRVEL